jgi:transcription elongation factor SPT6
MELLQENLGIKFQKKRKRIKMGSGSEDDDDETDRRSTVGGQSHGHDDTRGGEDGDELPDPDAVQAEGEDGDGYESEDVNDFIVDEDGQPIQRERKKKKAHIFADSARQMAEDIFGVAFDYDEFEQYAEGEEYETDDDEDDEDLDEDERRERPERKKKKERKKKQTKTIFDIFEPRELELRHFTDQDNEIRNTDVPERMLLRSVPVTAVPEESNELELEAAWIFKHGFIQPTVSKQEGYTRDDCKEWQMRTSAQEKIKKALDFMRQQFHEVPFIAFYRKEYVLPELKINDLWRVYKMDELWCKLQTRKRNLRTLCEKMQRFQVGKR